MIETSITVGYDGIDWFETLARAEKSHAGRFRRILDTLERGDYD